MYVARHAFAAPDLALPMSDFKKWPDLMSPGPAKTSRAVVFAAYGVGILGGALWGGWRGALGGWLAAAAVRNVIGGFVYVQQAEPRYHSVGHLVGAAALVQAGIAAWLASQANKHRVASGKKNWSLR
jgi:hypothetical protein